MTDTAPDLPCLPCLALPCPALPCHYILTFISADYHHAKWTAHISTFTQHFPAIVHGQPEFEHLPFRITPCYMNTLISIIYSPHYCNLHEQPTFKQLPCVYLPCCMDSLLFKFNLQIPAMLNGQPTFQHLHFRFTPCYINSLHFNIYSSDSRHATWRAHISTFSLQISAMLHEKPTFQH